MGLANWFEQPNEICQLRPSYPRPIGSRICSGQPNDICQFIQAPWDDDDDIGVSGESQQEYMRRQIEKRNKKPAPRRRAAPKVMRTVRELRQLLSFENAEWIGIEIRGRGALDGSDLKTQIKIKEISEIVKQLVQTFGTRFTILKVAVDQEGHSRGVCHNLRPYWDPPTFEDRASVRRGDPTIQALMRVQIDDWTYEAPRIITAASMTRERLL